MQNILEMDNIITVFDMENASCIVIIFLQVLCNLSCFPNIFLITFVSKDKKEGDVS